MGRFIQVSDIPGQPQNRVGWLDRKTHKITYRNPNIRFKFNSVEQDMRAQIRASPDFKKYSIARDEALQPFRDESNRTADILDAAEERINNDLRKLGWDAKSITGLKRHVRENRQYPEAESTRGVDWQAHDAQASERLDVYQFHPDGVGLDSLYGTGWMKDVRGKTT